MQGREKGWTSSASLRRVHQLLAAVRLPRTSVILTFPAVGKDEVLRVLEQKLPSRIKGTDGGVFWHTKTITADRVRARIQTVLDWAEARGYRAAGTPNPARWRGFLDQLLAAPRRIAPGAETWVAVPYAEVPAVMAAFGDRPECRRAVPALHHLNCRARLGEALKSYLVRGGSRSGGVGRSPGHRDEGEARASRAALPGRPWSCCVRSIARRAIRTFSSVVGRGGRMWLRARWASLCAMRDAGRRSTASGRASRPGRRSAPASPASSSSCPSPTGSATRSRTHTAAPISPRSAPS